MISRRSIAAFLGLAPAVAASGPASVGAATTAPLVGSQLLGQLFPISEMPESSWRLQARPQVLDWSDDWSKKHTSRGGSQ